MPEPAILFALQFDRPDCGPSAPVTELHRMQADSPDHTTHISRSLPCCAQCSEKPS